MFFVQSIIFSLLCVLSAIFKNPDWKVYLIAAIILQVGIVLDQILKELERMNKE